MASTARLGVLSSIATMAMLIASVSRTQAQTQAPDLRIGALDQPAEQVFGRIGDVVVDSAENVFILDLQALEVRWFARGGVFRGKAGGSGSGPGELLAPEAIAIDSHGRILVVDPRNTRVSIYAPTETGLVHVRDIRTVPAFDICILGELIVLLTATEAGLLTLTDSTGSTIRVFGALAQNEEAGPDAPPRAIRQFMDNRAKISCDPSSQSIIVLHERLPLVRSFTTNGTERRSTRLSDYHQVRDIRSSRSGGWTTAPDPRSGTAHTGAAIATSMDGELAITLREGSLRDPDGQLELRVLSARDGRELRRGDTQVIVQAIQRRTVFGIARSPYPQIHRYRESWF